MWYIKLIWNFDSAGLLEELYSSNGTIKEFKTFDDAVIYCKSLLLDHPEIYHFVIYSDY
jgi:hypothetical protein